MNYAIEQFNCFKNDTTKAYIEILSHLQKKSGYGDGINKLNAKEKTIFHIGCLEAEINNGGFSQYFFNSSGRYKYEAITALEEVGAVYTSELLKKAIQVSKLSLFRKWFNKDISENQEEKLEKLDNDFYEYEEDILELQIRYIQKNIKYFVG
jgi:hypothetical protein